MSEQTRMNSFHQTFECFRFDTAACDSRLFPVPSHRHYFSEVLIVRSGAVRIIRVSSELTLHPGELIYISPLVQHAVDSADGKPVVFDVVKFSATRLREIPTYLSDIRSLALDAAHAHLPVYMSTEEVQKYHLADIISECLVECQRQDFAWDLHVRALIYLLITGLTRFWIARRENFTDQPLLDQDDPLLEIPGYLEQNISEPLKVEDLARRCSLSYPWFAKRFREFYGLSCKQFIEHIRTETVEQYLVYSDLDLAKISSRTGYTDCSHMVKDFRRMTGTTPGQFRSLMKIHGQTPFSRFSGHTLLNHPSKG